MEFNEALNTSITAGNTCAEDAFDCYYSTQTCHIVTDAGADASTYECLAAAAQTAYLAENDGNTATVWDAEAKTAADEAAAAAAEAAAAEDGDDAAEDSAAKVGASFAAAAVIATMF